MENRRTVRIEWGHCDPAGIVFFPRYLEMFDASTGYLFEKAFGMTKFELLARYNSAGFPIVRLQTEFHFSSRYGDEVEVVSHAKEIGKSSFVVQHQLLRGEVLAIECTEKRVWTQFKDAEHSELIAVPLPEVLRRALLA